ncbi:hypothetical protein HJG60_009600 [Phyllostomus discolor]|uniref:Uncharacterized protein n=1 Tax=Phyllostomus discolor TaxID=89673 RepID=A0A834DAM6_9CHIR|nr:hypothetical protein HJG60_009600 [Phyllostomus discolor]
MEIEKQSMLGKLPVACEPVSFPVFTSDLRVTFMRLILPEQGRKGSWVTSRFFYHLGFLESGWVHFHYKPNQAGQIHSLPSHTSRKTAFLREAISSLNWRWEQGNHKRLAKNIDGADAGIRTYSHIMAKLWAVFPDRSAFSAFLG